MSRASRARKVAAAAAFGGGGMTVLGVLGVGVVAAEARLARRWIGQPFGTTGPAADGVFGTGPDEPLELALLGDSSAVGLGTERPEETPGALLAAGLAAESGGRVHLTNVAVVGAESVNLAEQVGRLLVRVPSPHVAVVLIGANDVTHRVRPEVAVRALSAAVTRLCEAGAQVVVGTCPDLGTLEPVVQPLRTLVQRWSRGLAAAQTIAVVEAGGRSVSLADILGEQSAADRGLLFSADRFHPSAAGYARMAAALLPSVCVAAGCAPQAGAEPEPLAGAPAGAEPVSQAAVQAADDAGTEVTATQVAGADRGPRGRWVLVRRRRTPAPEVAGPTAGRTGDVGATP